MPKKNIEVLISSLKEDIEREVRDRLPRKIGVLAVNHFKQNFRDSGFHNNGLQPWKKSLRQLSSDTTKAKYKTLTSQRNHLMSSIQSHVGINEVSIENALPYAQIHNEGGILTPTITPKMKKFAWAMVYKTAKTTNTKKELSKEFQQWLGLALTKKKQLKIKIPKRQFIGDSQELHTIVENEIQQSIQKIKDKIEKI